MKVEPTATTKTPEKSDDETTTDPKNPDEDKTGEDLNKSARVSPPKQTDDDKTKNDNNNSGSKAWLWAFLWVF